MKRLIYICTLMLVGCVPTNIKKETIITTNITLTSSVPTVDVPVTTTCTTIKVVLPPKPSLPEINPSMSDDEINQRLILHIEALNKHIETLRDVVGQ